MDRSIVAWVGAIVAAVTLVSACTSTGRMSRENQSLGQIASGKSAAIDVSLTNLGTAAERVQAAQMIREQLPPRLIAEDIFRAVVEAPAAADYSVEVVIVGMQVTPIGKRIAFGFGPSRNSISVRVVVREQATGKQVSAFRASGFGARTYLTPEGYGIDDPVREVINQIAIGLH